MALVPKADGAGLEALVSAAGRRADVVAEITGLDYSSGYALDLDLYRVAGQ
jgi:hypothetical protein